MLLLDLIIFADDANMVFAQSDIRSLFSTANMELKKIRDWFKANKQ